MAPFASDWSPGAYIAKSQWLELVNWFLIVSNVGSLQSFLLTLSSERRFAPLATAVRKLSEFGDGGCLTNL